MIKRLLPDEPSTWSESGSPVRFEGGPRGLEGRREGSLER